MSYKNQPTPLHPSTSFSSSKSTGPKKPSLRSNAPEVSGDYRSVSYANCRPSTWEKISIVPLDTNGLKHSASSLTPSPIILLCSLFLPFIRRSPRSSSIVPSSSTGPSSAVVATAANEWHLAMVELSRKLLHATRKHDEALLESF